MIAEAINWHSVFFLLGAATACGFAVAVVVSSNIVRMAFYLIVSLAATAGLFMLAGAFFVGAMQIMIYVGGTLVLLVFGVMLTAQATFISMKTRSGDWVLAALAGGSLLALLVAAAISVPDWRTVRADQAGLPESAITTTSSIGAGFVGLRVDRLDQADPQLERGMSGYLLPFEAVGVHLLIVLIGAAYLARTRRRVRGTDRQPTVVSEAL